MKITSTMNDLLEEFSKETGKPLSKDLSNEIVSFMRWYFNRPQESPAYRFKFTLLQITRKPVKK
jgi:hypothetical protein